MQDFNKELEIVLEDLDCGNQSIQQAKNEILQLIKDSVPKKKKRVGDWGYKERIDAYNNCRAETLKNMGIKQEGWEK